MRRIAALCCAFAYATVALAGTPTVFNFLLSDYDARAAGLAGSFFTVPNDPTSLFYNPASPATLKGARGGVSFSKHLLDINAGTLSYGRPVEDVGTFSGGIIFQHYGSFTEMDELGTSLGTFTASDMAIVAGYAATIDSGLTWGASAKFIYSSIAGHTSTAAAVDIGILYAIPNSRFSFGASIRNIGRQFSTYDGFREPLPLDVSVGASVTPKGLPLLLNVALHKLNQDANNFGERFRSFTIGGEFTLSKVLVARFGYNNEVRKDLVLDSSRGLTGFSIGVGINVKTYRLDYALSSLGDIGSLHRVSLSTDF